MSTSTTALLLWNEFASTTADLFNRSLPIMYGVIATLIALFMVLLILTGMHRAVRKVTRG